MEQPRFQQLKKQLLSPKFSTIIVKPWEEIVKRPVNHPSKSPIPKQKPKIPHSYNRNFLQQYQRLLKNLAKHALLLQNQMNQTLNRHDQFYQNTQRILKNLHTQSRAFLQNKIQQIFNTFDNQVQKLNKKIDGLCCPTTPVPQFKEFKDFQSLKSFKIQAVKVEYPGLSDIQDYFRKLTIGSWHEQSQIQVLNDSSEGELQMIQSLSQLTCRESLSDPLVKATQPSPNVIDDYIILELSESSEESLLAS